MAASKVIFGPGEGKTERMKNDIAKGDDSKQGEERRVRGVEGGESSQFIAQ